MQSMAKPSPEEVMALAIGTWLLQIKILGWVKKIITSPIYHKG